MNDELIIKYIKKRKEKGMEMLIDDYRGIITSVSRRHLGGLQSYEEECVSDVFLSIWTNIKYFDKDKNTFKNWVCAIAKYKAIDYKRKYLLKGDVIDIIGDISYVDTQLIELEIKEEICEMLSHLNDKDRELFVEYYLEGENLENIAEKNHTKVENLHNRLSRGRKKIRESVYK